MRLRALLLALAAVVVLPVVLSACSKPMENKTLDNTNRDNTASAMKKAGGTDAD
jgi:hypothetical protein